MQKRANIQPSLVDLSGVVERITYVNDENGYTVCRLKSRGHHDLITIVGNLPGISAGSVLELRGRWKTDPKYGRQFVASSYNEKLPATAAGIEKYLGSGLIKGIGPVYAKRIVKKFKEDTLKIIEQDPGLLLEIEGIGDKRIEMVKAAWEEQREVRNIMVFLQSHGVSTTYGAKIYKQYGDGSIQTLIDNPYRLADDIWGIGFKTADRIASNLGFDANSYERIRSGINYVLGRMSDEGHCFSPKGDLIEEARGLLETEDQLLDQAIDKMLKEGSLIGEEEGAIYLPPFYHSERGTAKRINEIVSANTPFASRDMRGFLSKIEENNQVSYDEKQREAIMKAGMSKFMVLTGGPGTGKTFTTLGIISLYKALGANILLAAPTGRAAKRMSEVTGMEAKTIHRLLEFKPGQGYIRNDMNPLRCDVIIIDEVSMVDLILMYNLLKAIPDNAIVILVGDVDQLPSVGAGNVLRDIIGSESVTVVKLTNIFRQARGSMIITNAHRINQGKMPLLRGGPDRDFFFVDQDDPEKIPGEIVDLVSTRLSSYYRVDPIKDIQVLCPMLRGNTGAHNINRLMQERLSPKGPNVNYGDTVYRKEDKVMQIKNNYDKRVFNGDIGFIERINLEDRSITISFDDRPVEYDYSDLDEIMLSYACTVHKSQGSEYPIVVAPLTIQHYMMLQRNLLYTCITRARRVLVLIGTKQAIGMAVHNNKIADRNTMLAKRLREYS
ncbi:MAG TPA: ATP-dependent RecD-like DNA helicase [Bacillota bacterium]|nr:ATP-dependent RecD-like DNA helicase [Bacillota bacterium]